MLKLRADRRASACIFSRTFAWLFVLLILSVVKAASQSFGTNYSRLFLSPTHSSPSIGLDGSYYIGATDGVVRAIQPGGTQSWGFSASGEVDASPTVDFDGRIYFGSSRGTFYALTPQGKQIWTFTAAGAIHSSSAIAPNGPIYFGTDARKLYALNPDGTLQWDFSTGGQVHSSPAIGADGTIYFGCYDGRLYALQPDGTKKWEFNTRAVVYASPALGPDDTIYIGSVNHNLYAVNSDGTQKWLFTTAGAVHGSPAIGPDGAVYFGSDDDKVYALDAQGNQRWAFTAGAPVYATPVISADGLVIVGSLDHNVYALSAVDGTLRWQFPTSNQVYSSAAINLSSVVSFGSMDGNFYQLRTTNLLAQSTWPMFGRNLQHTSSGFVGRLLPTGYSPGRTLVVTLQARPPAGTTAYEMEDSPPAGWTVTEISDNGLFDPINMRVKFGPFFDDLPRTVTYQVTPPLTQVGLVQFNGWSWADNWDNPIGGPATLNFVPAHPADYNPVQGTIKIDNLTGYGAAWKTGQAWPIGPNPIPVSYVTRAAALWLGGEYYEYNPTIYVAPSWWVNLSTIPSTMVSNPPAPTYPSGTGGSTTLVNMSRQYQIGVPLLVELKVMPGSNAIVYAIEETPPTGWGITNVSQGGQWDALLKKLKWGPFFDNQSRFFTYQVLPPTNAAGPVAFQGVASIDGTNLVYYGQRYATDVPVVPSLGSVMPLPDGTVQLTLQGETGFFYVIETSTDLIRWDPTTSFFSDSDVMTVIDPDAVNYQHRFYRALLP